MIKIINAAFLMDYAGFNVQTIETIVLGHPEDAHEPMLAQPSEIHVADIHPFEAHRTDAQPSDTHVLDKQPSE